MRSADFSKFIATFFCLGYFPLAAGSLASAYGGLICFLFGKQWLMIVGIFVVFTVLGFLTSQEVEKVIGQKDPSCIVIDEFCGALIAFFLLPMTPAVIWTTFFLFRAFDMFKIYPACKLEKVGGGVGVMMDDLVAGVYTNIVMQIAVRLAGIA